MNAVVPCLVNATEASQPQALVPSLVLASISPAIPACPSGQLCGLDLSGSGWSGAFPQTRSAYNCYASCLPGSGAGAWLDPHTGSRTKKEVAAEETGRGKCPALWPEVLLTPSESHQSDGFLWPEAVVEISFLPPHSPDVPPPRLGKAREAWGSCQSQAAIQEMPFIASQAAGLHCLWGAGPNVGNRDD